VIARAGILWYSRFRKQETYVMKTILMSAAIAVASATSAFAGCAFHEKQAMSCGDGTSYDSETKTCVPTTS